MSLAVLRPRAGAGHRLPVRLVAPRQDATTCAGGVGADDLGGAGGGIGQRDVPAGRRRGTAGVTVAGGEAAIDDAGRGVDVLAVVPEVALRVPELVVRAPEEV